MSERRDPLGGLAAASIQARWNVTQMLRGRLVWVACVFAMLPPAYTFLASANGANDWADIFGSLILMVGVVAPLFMASSLAEEIEDRTYTYLWSRPVPRWSVVMGKLVASIPIAGGLCALSLVACHMFFPGGAGAGLGRGIGSLIAGTIAACAVSSGLAILFPRFGLGLTYAYLLAIDLPVGQVPFSIRNLSITQQIRVVAGASDAAPLWRALVWLAVVSALWLAVAFLRLRRAEFSSGEK